jgi:hypothetical protein
MQSRQLFYHFEGRLVLNRPLDPTFNLSLCFFFTLPAVAGVSSSSLPCWRDTDDKMAEEEDEEEES